MEERLQTIIVLRNDHGKDVKFGTADSNVVLEAGELGVHYLDNGNVIVKSGNGVDSWKDLPQVESVLEEDITLTYNFGRHKTSNGYVKAGGKDMTFSQWVIDSLSEILNPTINYPTAKLEAGTITTDTGDKEIGSKITKFAWKGTPTYGSYKDATNSDDGTYGTTADSDSSATGIGASNFTWTVTNSLDSQTGNTEDGTFTMTSENYKQITSESTITYAYLNGKAVLDASKSRIPYNNVGIEYTDGKIAGFDENGTTEKTFTNVAVACAGFRKPFWGVLTSPLDIDNLTSDQVRGLANKGTAKKSFPGTLSVPAGSKQVIFCAVKGAYNSLAAKDTAAMNAGVTFTKHAAAVQVNGANDYTAADYDVWEVTWADPIASAKSLALTWS